MKVGTDACIFGAYMAAYCTQRKPPPAHLLDIGTGTGLLSMLIAQQITARIDAVEMDAGAFEQAKENFRQSPFAGRLNACHGDILHFSTGEKYDGIITNPPFYEGDLKSGNKKKDAARHEDTLTLEQLFSVVDGLLAPGGFFAVLLPYQRIGYVQQLAEAGRFFLWEELLIQHSAAHPFSRAVLIFGRQWQAVVKRQLAITHNKSGYSPAFTALLKEYYLKL